RPPAPETLVEFDAVPLPTSPKPSTLSLFPTPAEAAAAPGLPQAGGAPPAAGEGSKGDAPAPWTLAEARAALKAATRNREQLLEVVLSYARKTFDFAAAFAVMGGAAVGWEARGEGASPARTASVYVPLDSPSVFRTVSLTRGSYLG